MNKSKDLMKEMTERHEASIIKHLENKLALLEQERELKKHADLTVIKPSYGYENDTAWLEHVRAVGLLNIDNEKLSIEKQIDQLKLKAVERADLEAAEKARKESL